ncbi:hypothetical protein [Colwellia sp. 75C3]|uniref:hypothetical protein n=1 Tax=Colwellia sp. 75C3 TaxID=888425 RepID=UPI001E4B7278|nr:hypothetical protein [Colwellia sp. 75C3]
MKTTVMTQQSEQHNKGQRRVERRKTSDVWRYIQTSLAVTSWLLFLIALVMSYYAAPDKDYGVLRYYDVEIRQFWLTPLTGYLYILLWLSALGSYLALITDKYRSRRRNDNPHFNLMFLLGVNLFWLVYILVKAQ